jgi:hypothetical protein
MLAITLGTLIILSGFYLLQHSLRIYHQQQLKIDAQQQRYYVQHLMTSIIRMAGYLPCSSLQHEQQSIAEYPIWVMDKSTLQKNQRWLNTLVADTPVLQITFASPISQTVSMETTKIVDERSVFTDCEHTRLLSAGAHLSLVVNRQGLLSPLYTYWFYLRQSTDQQGSGLFMRTSNGRAEELIDAIKQLHFSFAGENKHFVQAAHIENWYSVHYCKVTIDYENGPSQTFTVRLRNA